MSGIIYCITNTVSGKQYVGQTTKASVLVRWHEHVAQAMRGSTDCVALFSAIRKHGAAAFTIEEIERTAELDTREQHHINQLGTLAPAGYNLTPGGVRFQMTPETRQKIREANMGIERTNEWRANLSAALKGRVLSEEARRKISLARRGKPGTPHTAEWKAAARARMLGNQNGQGNKGKPLTEETKSKLSKAKMGTKLSDSHKAKISASLIGNTRRRDYAARQVNNG